MGLPYIRHDGKVNPKAATRLSITDGSEKCGHGRDAGAGLFSPATKLTRLTRRNACASGSLIRRRDESQSGIRAAVPGVNTGRGTGVLEGRNVAAAADAAQLLAGSAAWTPTDDAALNPG